MSGSHSTPSIVDFSVEPQLIRTSERKIELYKQNVHKFKKCQTFILAVFILTKTRTQNEIYRKKGEMGFTSGALRKGGGEGGE